MNNSKLKYLLLLGLLVGGVSCATMSGSVDGVTSDQLRKITVPQYADNGRGKKMPAIIENMTMDEAKEVLGQNPIFQGIKKTPNGAVGILVYSAKGDLRVNFNLAKHKKCNAIYFYEKEGMRYKFGTQQGRWTRPFAMSYCNLGAFNDYQTIFPK